MDNQTDDPVRGGQPSASQALDVGAGFRRLLATLSSRARWLGSRDAEGAAQEALKRSLENALSQPAIVYYFGLDAPAKLEPPEWALDQLLAWLHGVLYYVVLEEHHRVSSRREVPINEIQADRPDGRSGSEIADPGPHPLDTLIQEELQRIVADCIPTLEPDYRKVLALRVEGLRYGEIAARLGVNENTVATWVSRGTRALAQCVQRRTGGLVRMPQVPDRGKPHV